MEPGVGAGGQGQVCPQLKGLEERHGKVHHVKKMIYLSFIFDCARSFAVCRRSLVTVSSGCSLVSVRRLLMVVASLIAEHRLWGLWAQKLWLTGSRALAQ